MRTERLHHKASASLVACLLVVSPFASLVRAQSRVDERPKPDVERALNARTSESTFESRKGGYTPMQSKATLPERPSVLDDEMKAVDGSAERRPPA
ncbi:MAG TPA: hypothetical protein VKB86_10160, partial [Pyrinomonadaceae bacterium]|nr:hypothetical protein [Pyrinomonadaceae bacterium]